MKRMVMNFLICAGCFAIGITLVSLWGHFQVQIDERVFYQVIATEQANQDRVSNLYLERLTLKQIRARERIFKIEEELNHLASHPWAGDYQLHKHFLTLAPQNGFVISSQGCMGNSTVNYGQVEVNGNKLKLHFELPNGSGRSRGFMDEYYIVPWGERHYLIESNRVIEFCNFVNQKWATLTYLPQDLLFFLRKGDATKPIADQPQIPDRFRPYLLPNPIKATITSVGKPRIKVRTDLENYFEAETRIVLNAGAQEGVLPGIKFEIDHPEVYDKAEVVSVSVTTSIARLFQTGELPFTRPKVGWIVTTCKKER